MRLSKPPPIDSTITPANTTPNSFIGIGTPPIGSSPASALQLGQAWPSLSPSTENSW